MTILRHTTPCPQCPFRRKSLAGYLGNSDADEFVDSTVNQEEHMPCHLSVDYEDPDWRETQLATAAHCAGSLIFLKNQCKLPHDEVLRKRMERVEKDTKKVFNWPHEFKEHHKS